MSVAVQQDIIQSAKIKKDANVTHDEHNAQIGANVQIEPKIIRERGVIDLRKGVGHIAGEQYIITTSETAPAKAITVVSTSSEDVQPDPKWYILNLEYVFSSIL